MPWNIAVVNHRVLDLSRAMTSTVSVLSVWGFRMHAMRFMGFLNANFARISVSKPSAVGLRCLRRSHPRFPVAHRKGSDVELEAMESEQTGLTFSLPPSPEHERMIHEYLYPSPGARDTVSFGLDDILLTAASDSEDFGPALADALPPSGQEDADFTNLVGSVEQGYTATPVVEDNLASHLSPSLAPSWKSRPLLPTKPCRTTSALIGKSYIAAGQAGMTVHTMAILQTYQADVLKEMDEGTGLTPEAVKELRRATDLALRATKHTARAVRRSMASSVAAERHLWLNLTEIREKKKVFLLDAPISQSGLFGEAVSSVVEKFSSAKTQSAALKQFMPRRTINHSTPSSSLSREQCLPRKEPSGRSGAQAAHPPPTTVWGARGRPFPRQRPRRWVDLKRPNRPAASAPPSHSRPSSRNEESRFTATRRGQNAKAYLPASNVLSSLRSVTTTPRGLVCRTSSPSFFLGLAVGGRIRLSPLQSVLLPPAGHMLGDTVGSLLQRTDPVPATFQSSTSLSINLNKDAKGFPSWWRASLLPGLLDTPTQVCLPLHDTLLPLSHFIHEWERLSGVSL